MKSRILVTIAAIALVALAAPIATAFQNPMPELKSAAVVACGTSPTIINPGAGSTFTQPVQSICVQSAASNAVYIGGSDVTTSTGFILPPASATAPVQLCFDAQRAYCRVAAATENVRVVYGLRQ
jgi:hypothetical protein